MALQGGTTSISVYTDIYLPDLPVDVSYIPVITDVATYNPVEVPLRPTLYSVLFSQIASKVHEYVDPDRFLKTLLNFGGDTQSLITNWKLDPNDSSKLLIKLLEPLGFGYDVGSTVFISTEVADTVIDTVKFELLPQPDTSLWLRPKNTQFTSLLNDSSLLNTHNHSIRNQTLETIGISLTGNSDNYGGYTFEDNTLRKWYTDDYSSVELNVDYTDYNNFITYSSAELRLQAFRQKLLTIRELEKNSRFIGGLVMSSSVFGVFTTGSSPTELPLVAPYIVEGSKKNALEIENVIRGFDGYERYLFYQSGSAYSASAYYEMGGTEYNTDGCWPKRDSDTHLYEPIESESIQWYEKQIAIAQRYDAHNQNLLANAIPKYLIEDPNSQEFIRFTQLIGHFFDNLKGYIDSFPQMYDRNVKATVGLSQDLVWDVAKSFGVSLTHPHSVDSLFSYTTDTSVTKKRELTTELWKRFLHNMPYLNRIRGTSLSLKALLGIFGLNEQVVGIRETDTTTTGSFEIFDEVTNALNFNPNAYLILPISSSNREVTTVQFRFNNATRETTTLAVGDIGVTSGSWSVRVSPHPSQSSAYGRVEVLNSAGGLLLTSSYVDMFSEDYFDVMLRYNTSSIDNNYTGSISLHVAQSDGEEILYSSSMSTSQPYLVNSWPKTRNIYIGGSGSLSTNNFNGYVDEIRVWGEQIKDGVFLTQVLDPGSFTGNDYTSPVENLYIRLSFHSPVNAGAVNLLNESPYHNKDGVSDFTKPLLADIRYIVARGFTSVTSYPYTMTRVSRKIRQYTTNTGAYSYGSNKILIAPPAVFNEVTSTGEPILHRTKSIVSIDTRRTQPQTKKFVGFFVSPTDATNNMIIRALGNLDIKSMVGYPGNRFATSYKDLEKLQEYYNVHYNASINIGEFVRFFDEIVPTLFEQATQVVPAKTILGTGVVIEPNILEHKKLVFDRPLKIDGNNTRRNSNFISTDGTYNRDVDVTISSEVTLDIADDYRTQSADYRDLNVSVNFLDTTNPQGDSTRFFNANIISTYPSQSGLYSTYTGSIDASQQLYQADEIYDGLLDGATIRPVQEVTSADYNYYNASVITEIYSGSLDTSFVLFDSSVDKQSYIEYLKNFSHVSQKVAENAAISYKPGNIINVAEFLGTNPDIIKTSIFDLIPPRSDLSDYGVTNYFNRQSGIYYFETVQKEIIGKNQLNFLAGAEATWSFGTQYNKNDVVVQYGATEGTAKYYNGKLFRYIAQDSPSVSYNFPALDQNRWVPIFYRGKSVQTPYRIIFDTNKGSGVQSITELPVTRVSVSRAIIEPKRYSTSIRYPVLEANSRNTGTIRMSNIASLFSMHANLSNIRIRLYDTLDSLDADSTREFGTEPIGNHGVLWDMRIVGDEYRDTTIGLYPAVTLINNDIEVNSSIYYVIDYLQDTNSTSGLVLTLNYFAIEAQPILPIGYLQRHYKFYRDTLLSTRRRNYLGCTQTQNTTTDGRSPVEVNITGGSTIMVSPNILQEENLGGTNLNVT